jgi:type IV fimbrial biogenesis protein FimT
MAGRHRRRVLGLEEGPDMLITQACGTRVAVPSARGFSLIELMVTISLLALLVTLSLPSFTGWIRNSQIRTVAEALQGGLRTAQAESLRRNQRVVLFFTDDAPAKNVVPATHPATDATPSATGKNWALQTAPDVWGATEYITGGALADAASNVAITNSSTTKAVCFGANGRLVKADAGTSGTGVTGFTDVTCTTDAVAFNVKSGTADRPLRVVLQLGGQVRMCDPNRPTLSATAPDGCPTSPL